MADRRLLDTSESELERQMLRAAVDEKVPADVRRRALSTLGLLAIAPLGTVSTAAASAEVTAAGAKTLGWHAALAKAGAVVGLGGAALGVGTAVVQTTASERTQVAASSVSQPGADQPRGRAPAARAREGTLSITSQAVPPWHPPARPAAAYTVAPAAGRARSVPARSVVASRSSAGSTREPEAPLRPAVTSIREEIDLLDRARAQLARGNARTATEIIGHYFARYPAGVLRAEAEAVRREARLAGAPLR